MPLMHYATSITTTIKPQKLLVSTRSVDPVGQAGMPLYFMIHLRCIIVGLLWTCI